MLQINAAETRKVANLEQEAVNADAVLEKILAISDKGREDFSVAGGVAPEGGWDAAGEASWTRTFEAAAAERKALEEELEKLSAAGFPGSAPAAASAAAGGVAAMA